ncbi:hypothetical protein D3C80_1559760 [compost metagenome]
MVNGIQVTVDNVADCALRCIHPDRGAIAQHRQHAIAAYCHALGLVKLHTVVAQAALAETQTGALAFFNDKSS